MLRSLSHARRLTARFKVPALPARTGHIMMFGTEPPKAVPLSQLSESFASGTSSNYMEQMYERWQQNPSSVHASWDVYFRNVDNGVPPGQAFQAPPSLDWVGVKAVR